MPNPNLPINARMNTYIGARYVPKFAEPTEWSAQNKYDPLTIVTYQGNSYTSKTFVPVGVDILNTTYWAETGAYNAQVEQYRQEVLSARQDIDSLQSLTSQQYTLKNRRFVMFGDSIMAGYPNLIPFTTRFKNYLNLTDSQMYVFATGGTAFINTTTPSLSFLNLLNSNAGSVPNPETVTDVYFMGGTNEGGEFIATIQMIQTVINRTKTLFPNAKISVGFLAFGTSIHPLNDNKYKAYNRCQSYGASFFDMSVAYHLLSLTADGSHPNQQGQNEIGFALCQYALNGNINWWNGLISTSIGDGIFQSCDTGGIRFYGRGSINLTTPWTSGLLNFGTLNDSFTFLHPPFEVIVYYVKDGEFTLGSANLQVNASKNIMLRLYGAPQGFTRLFINPFYVTLGLNDYNLYEMMA